jgi:hypothetical protein
MNETNYHSMTMEQTVKVQAEVIGTLQGQIQAMELTQMCLAKEAARREKQYRTAVELLGRRVIELHEAEQDLALEQERNEALRRMLEAPRVSEK